MNVLVNQVGYELAGPKRFVCRSEQNRGPSARFEVIDGTGRSLMEGSCRRFGASQEGPWYYAGDFSAFRQAGGDFQIRFEAGGQSAVSPRFGVGTEILWRLTKPVVLQMLRSSRATQTGAGRRGPPGTLGEDARFYELSGGWSDSPGRESGSLRLSARALLALALAAARDPRDLQVRSELRWGADWLRRAVFRYPSSGRGISRIVPGGELLATSPAEPEPHSVLLCGFLCARVAETCADIDLLRRGERVWEEYHEDLGGLTGPEADSAMLLTEVALHVATMEPRYLASAERRAKALVSELESGGGPAGAARGAGPVCAPISLVALAEFASSLPQHPATPAVKLALGRCVDARVEAASREVWGFVPPPGDVPKEDIPMRVAEEAWAVLSARRATARPGCAELAASALDWLLGVNPWGKCLLRGAGMQETLAPLANGELDGALVPPPSDGDEPGPGRGAHIGGGAAYLAAMALL